MRYNYYFKQFFPKILFFAIALSNPAQFNPPIKNPRPFLEWRPKNHQLGRDQNDGSLSLSLSLSLSPL